MAAAAIPTGFTGLLITRIITDVYHLLAHETHAETPSGSERSGLKRIRAVLTRAGPSVGVYRYRIVICGT